MTADQQWAQQSIHAMANATAIVNDADAFPVIFDQRYLDVLGVAASGPVATVAELDWPDPADGDVIDIGESRFTVISPEPDGAGAIVLKLQRTD